MRRTYKYTIAALAAMLVGVLIWSNKGSPVLAIALAVVAGIVGYVVWDQFEKLLYKAGNKAMNKAVDAASNAYQKHQQNKNQ